MRKFLLIQFVFLVASAARAQKAHYGHGGSALLPDPVATPGLVRTTNTDEVCHGGSTRRFRHTTAQMKKAAYVEYGAVKKAGICCEVDHLIPLELGGADNLKNLWPQPYRPIPGAYEKDKLENYLYREVCARRISLTGAQREIATDWYEAYLGAFRK